MTRRHEDAARSAAFEALRRVHAQDAYANLALGEVLAARRLEPRDAAFATELLSGTCRLEGTYRAIVARVADPAKPLDDEVVDVLLLGAHQALSMRVPAHAAVATTVDLAALAVGEKVTGVVNALMRRILAKSLTAWLDLLSSQLDGLAALAVRYHHPEWIVAAYADILPPDELPRALAANNVAPVTTLAVRPGLLDRRDLMTEATEPTPFSPWGQRRAGNPADLPALRAGKAGVQDEGSQLVVLALSRAAAPRGPWLDLCAGPGGKSALMAGLALGHGEQFVAAEVQPHRAKLVALALRAYKQSPRPAVLVADGTRPPWRDASFARVLADVPCTGLGALRRRPEARWRRQPADLETLRPSQRLLLESAIRSARPGGLVAYVTCSPHRAETTEVVGEVLAGFPGIEILDAPALLPEVPDAANGPFLQLWPHRHGTDAMFLALLRAPLS